MKDPLSNYPGYALRRASNMMMADLTRGLAALELRPTESTILQLIDANPGVKQAELCTALDIQRANMTPIIGRLDARGLIARKALDRRSAGLTLTEAGEALRLKALRVIEVHEQTVLQKIGPDLTDAVMKGLKRIWQSG